MLEIKNLKAKIEGTQILKGINMSVNPGEVHAIMGPNGSGKSTLASVIAGKEEYVVNGGSITYKREDLLDLAPEERAQKGIFLSFQYPVEIPGISVANFIKTAINQTRKAKGLKNISSRDLLEKMNKMLTLLDMKKEYLSRSMNDGFSGGEKKRNEIFQLAMLNPTIAILDETDSGLDIDAIRIVSNGVNKLKSNDTATILITHYQRLLNYISPDFVHVLHDGKIVKSGGKELALELEEKGYDWINKS